MYIKKQDFHPQPFQAGVPRRKVLFRLLSFFVVIVLLAGSSSPVFATTPPISKAESKPEDFVIWLPFRDSAKYKMMKGYGVGDLHINGDYYALDFGREDGTQSNGVEVRPIAKGTILKKQAMTGGYSCYGNVVLIEHVLGGKTYQSLYAHLDRFNENIQVGQQVDPSTKIGYIGKSGTGTKCPNGQPWHLHFALYRVCAESEGCDYTSMNGEKIKAVVPEPFVGREVYEGFGLSTNWTGPLYSAEVGADTIPGPPSSAKWGANTIGNGIFVHPGESIMLSVVDLPSDTKEVRFTVWYETSNGSGWGILQEDKFSQNWRILNRCWSGKSGCSWGPFYTSLEYKWEPFNDIQLKSDAPWLPSGQGNVFQAFSENGQTNTPVCISFDVFDNAGNVAYAPAGVQCSLMSSGIEATSIIKSGAASDSARLIYIDPIYSQNNDNTLPSGYWTSPNNGQTISSNTVTLSVTASDNAGGSGVREVRWAAKYNGQWYGVGTDYDAPYSVTWDWCAAGAQNGDVELGFEVWDNANNKWVYSEHAPAGNIHINKNYNCSTGTSGSINWSANFYNGMDHWWDPNNNNNQMCSTSFPQGNLDKNYGNGSPCGGGATDNWVGDYKATVNFEPGYYAFWVDHDDWLKLRVDGREIYSVNGVHSEWKCVDNGYMYLSGNHNIWAILAEQGGDARVKVEWSRSNGVCDLPDPFIKASPLNGLGDQPVGPLLSWAATEGASSYSYCVDTTNDNSCVGWLNVGSATSVTPSGLNPGTTYYWNVRAYSQGGAGRDANDGTWWSFTTQMAAPPAFSLTGPVNPSSPQAIDVTTLTWAGDGSAWYQYCYDTTNDSACENDMWYSAGTDTSTSIANLAEHTTYYWQVRASNGGGTTYANNGTWSSFITQTFADVAPTYWAGNFIERLFNNGITGGCSVSPLQYCPATAVTRAQMAVFLLRAKHGSTYVPDDATGNVFLDVPPTYWAAKWIEQLAKEGITGGCGPDIYCPDTVVTRDQMAVFLLRAKHGSAYIPPGAMGVFGDVPVGYWSASWIEQLAAEGITGGCGNGNYCPIAPVNRDQMAVFLVRAFNLP